MLGRVHQAVAHTAGGDAILTSQLFCVVKNVSSEFGELYIYIHFNNCRYRLYHDSSIFLDNRKEWRKFERVQEQTVEYQLRRCKTLNDYEHPIFLTCLYI